MISDVIETSIKEALKELNLPDEKIKLEHPADLSHGDYSTNIALVLAKKVNENPRVIAEKIVKTLHASRPTLHDLVNKVEVAGAGFINFHLSQQFFGESLKEIIAEDKNFGQNKKLKGKKVIIEYTDPNPFKEFHIGHLMSNAIGEAIARITENMGADVKRACYQGDVGLHVAKAIWGIDQSGRTNEIRFVGVSVRGAITMLGEWYAAGAFAYEHNQEAKKAINEINKIIYDILARKKVNDVRRELISNLYNTGKKLSLDYFEIIYKKLGTKFDFYFFESETGELGEKIVKENIGKVFEKSDSAVVFHAEKFNTKLHTRVFISSEGLPTYEAKELGLAKIKYEKYPYEKSIVITGNEVNDYFNVLLEAMKIIFPELAKKTFHIGHGMLRLPTGKMSSRKGNVITGESLINQVEELVGEKIKGREFESSEIEKVKEAVAIGAIKYSILRQAIGGNIVYDFEKSISFEGDSGPYLQYSYARAASVLRKIEPLKLLKPRFNKYVETRFQQSDKELERLLYRFPEIVERAANEYEPHYVVTYLTELAGAFNNFYAHNPILDAGEATSYRLVLTKAFTIIMKNGLNLLAIPVLEKM